MFNWIEFMYLQLGLSMVLLSALVNFLESKLPNIIARTFRYGKFASERKSDVALKLEISKSSFKHFYAFGLVWTAIALYLGVRVYLLGRAVPSFIVSFLDALVGSNRQAKTDAVSTFVALCLYFLQVCRRFYETHFIQIFSKKAKINITHYLVGFIHYFLMGVTLLGNASGFVRDATAPVPQVHLRYLIDVRLILSAALFLYAWLHQFKSNLILINLRKNKTGAVVTEKHLMPVGGYFDLISSPHMFFEVVMYVALWVLLYRNTTMIYVVAFVLSNQVEVAHLTHNWYRSTFSDYPERRKAIIPYMF